MTTQTRSTTRARPAAVGTAIALAGVTTAALLVTTTGSAGAAGHPDLKITQHISGSSQSGHTFDTITVKNNGSATASHVSLQLYTNTNGAFGDIFSGTGSVCEVMPAPPPWDYGTACQFSATIAHGASLTIKGDFSGTVGAKFTNLATVGEYQGDASLKDNSSQVTSWFGPRANLIVGGTAKTGTHTGHLTAVTTVVNRGPNTADAVQEVVEAKNISGASATGSGSCQVVPPADGYDFAFSCVKSSLAQGASWKLTFNYSGPTGKTATMVTKVTALTIDPFTKNNSMTRKAKLK
jgi:hypothetical protein